jgi:hypothetical protein
LHTLPCKLTKIHYTFNASSTYGFADLIIQNTDRFRVFSYFAGDILILCHMVETLKFYLYCKDLVFAFKTTNDYYDNDSNSLPSN